MTEADGVARAVRLRRVEDQDIDVFFDHQADPQAVEMAAFPARTRDQVAAHWARVRADDTLLTRTIVVDGAVAGHVGSWPDGGQQLLGYWIGREWWGRGVATRAVALLVEEMAIRRSTPTSPCTTSARSASWRSAGSGGTPGRRRGLPCRTTASRRSSSCWTAT